MAALAGAGLAIRRPDSPSRHGADGLAQPRGGDVDRFTSWLTVAACDQGSSSRLPVLAGLTFVQNSTRRHRRLLAVANVLAQAPASSRSVRQRSHHDPRGQGVIVIGLPPHRRLRPFLPGRRSTPRWPAVQRGRRDFPPPRRSPPAKPASSWVHQMTGCLGSSMLFQANSRPGAEH